MNPIRGKLLDFAMLDLGVRDPLPYWLDVGVSASDAHGKSWCGAWYLAKLRQADLCSWLWPRLYFSRKLPTIAPSRAEPGDLVYFDQPFQHHAMLQSVEGNALHLIQGNYGTPGRVAESTVSYIARKPLIYSIEKLVAALELRMDENEQ